MTAQNYFTISNSIHLNPSKKSFNNSINSFWFLAQRFRDRPDSGHVRRRVVGLYRRRGRSQTTSFALQRLLRRSQRGASGQVAPRPASQQEQKGIKDVKEILKNQILANIQKFHKSISNSNSIFENSRN